MKDIEREELREITDRFLKSIDLWKKMNLISSDREFCLATGFIPQSFSKLRKGIQAVPLRVISAGITKFNFNPDYLFGLTDNPVRTKKSLEEQAFVNKIMAKMIKKKISEMAPEIAASAIEALRDVSLLSKKEKDV